MLNYGSHIILMLYTNYFTKYSEPHYEGDTLSLFPTGWNWGKERSSGLTEVLQLWMADRTWTRDSNHDTMLLLSRLLSRHTFSEDSLFSFFFKCSIASDFFLSSLKKMNQWKEESQHMFTSKPHNQLRVNVLIYF